MILATQKVFSRKHNMLEKNPATSHFPPYTSDFSIFPTLHIFLLPITNVFWRGYEAECSVFQVCSHGFSARLKLSKTVPCSVEHPSTNYLGEMFKNLEKIISSPVGFYLREDVPQFLTEVPFLNLLGVAAAVEHLIPPGSVGGYGQQVPFLQEEDSAVRQRRLSLYCFSWTFRKLTCIY